MDIQWSKRCKHVLIPFSNVLTISFLGNKKTQQTVVVLHSKVKFYVNRNKNFLLTLYYNVIPSIWQQTKSHLNKLFFQLMSVFIIHTHGVGLEAQINRNIIEQMLCQTTQESILQRKVQCSLCALQRLNKSVHMDVAIGGNY